MPSTTIQIPTFDFAGFYFPEILEALILYKRINLSELTDESEYEPAIQFLRMFSLVGHLNNTLLDLIANESTLPTAKLVETVRNQLRLIEYELSPASPAQADLIYELSKVFDASFEIVSLNSQVATEGSDTESPIYFEALEALTIDRTDQHSYVLTEEAESFTDYTTKANSPTTPADDWTPWSSPDVKDAIYWGHKQVMWDMIDAVLTTQAADITGVFEFYDGDWSKVKPVSVTNLGTQLEVDLSLLLGYNNRQGTLIRIKLNSTGQYEDIYSTWTGSLNIARTSNLLGQVTPSTDSDDYTVGSDWTILEVSDGTEDFTQNGNVEYTLPQTELLNWIATTIDGKTAYWIRYRIVSVSSPTNPVFQTTSMDNDKQYVARLGTQGKTRTEDPLGSSTGLNNQRFLTSKEYFIWSSETVTVDSVEWTRVQNFLASESEDKHYVIELGENDQATVVFGGNNLGKVPPIGVGNIAITYRHNAEEDGNAGSNTVTTDKTGLTYINKIWNPRQAAGWVEAEGATEDSLERAKIDGPATLRTKDVAIGPDDVEELAKQYTDDNGASPFSRANAFEEGYGPKTIELVVVASGGGDASSAQLDALDEYFNGDKYSVPTKDQHLVANQKVVSVNYSQKSISIVVTVYGKDITSTQIETALTNILDPEAFKSDDITYEWKFGETIPLSRLNHIIFNIDPSITKVVLNSPVTDVVLTSRELPVAGTISANIIKPS